MPHIVSEIFFPATDTYSASFDVAVFIFTEEQAFTINNISGLLHPVIRNIKMLKRAISWN